MRNAKHLCKKFGKPALATLLVSLTVAVLIKYFEAG